MTSKDKQIIECIPINLYLCNMGSPFYNDIYEILRRTGKEGLPVGIIARQVYNRHVGLFNVGLSYEKVYQNVRFFLWTQAGKASSPFTSGRERGWYALKCDACHQPELDFSGMQEAEQGAMEETNERKQTDMPSLF